MYSVLAITNRHLCKNDFLEQIKKICMFNHKLQTEFSSNSQKIESNNKIYNLCNIDSVTIVLREKDLSENDYEKLAIEVMKICEEYNTDCILHTYYNTAKKLKCKKIHLPLHILKSNPDLINNFHTIGVSVHSKQDALEAVSLGSSYLTAGHIFATDCKKDLPGRGVEFLTTVINNVQIPVYAIGGISSSNINKVIDAGAHGICAMSGLMNIDDPREFFNFL